MTLRYEILPRNLLSCRCNQKPAVRPQGSVVLRRARLTSSRVKATLQPSVDKATPKEYLTLALKEWAVTCAALGTGKQTVILRKGGIREPTFKAAGSKFALFPTSFHSKANLLTPEAHALFQQELVAEPKEHSQLIISYLAEVTGCWTTFDPSVLAALSEHHVWTEEFLDSRLRWRPKQPITVLELRCSAFQQPVNVQNDNKYWGCFSWVDLEQGVSSDIMKSVSSVLSDADFCDSQQGVRTALLSLQDCCEVSVPISTVT